MSTTVRTIKQFLSKLRKQNVAGYLEISYCGSGDSGQIDAVHMSSLTGNSTAIDAINPDYVENLCYDFLEMTTPGWEINEGQSGTIILNIDTNSINHDYDVPEPKSYNEKY